MKKKGEVKIINDGNAEKFPDLEVLFDGSSEFQWCLHCQRASKKGNYKLVPYDSDYYLLCPFDDCDGDIMMDIVDWDSYREGREDLPELPEEGKLYSL